MRSKLSALKPLATLPALLALAGCDTGNYRLFHPLTAVAKVQWWATLFEAGIMSLIIVPTAILIAWFVWRYRKNANAKYDPTWSHSLTLEILVWGIPLIVVEQNPERFGDCLRERYLAVLVDATRDEVLREAGIERARGLAIALDDDAKNVFIALTGRALNAGIYIVSRAGLPESEAKLLHAGVDRVVSPYAISGRRMAALMTRPRVVDIVETALQPGGIEHGIEEFVLPEHSPFVGHTVAELDLRAATGAIVLAVIDAGGKISSSPANGYRLQAGDSLVAIGTQPELRQLEGMAGGG